MWKSEPWGSIRQRWLLWPVNENPLPTPGVAILGMVHVSVDFDLSVQLVALRVPVEPSDSREPLTPVGKAPSCQRPSPLTKVCQVEMVDDTRLLRVATARAVQIVCVPPSAHVDIALTVSERSP